MDANSGELRAINGLITLAGGRLGARQDDPAVQSELARAICRDHLACRTAVR